MTGWLILLGLLTALAIVIGWRQFVGRREPGYLAVTEYWVYTTATKLPPQEKIMDRMISANPHNRRGYAAIGAREGMIFTDIRLHMGVALRQNNAISFRPDLFEGDVEPSAEALALLAESEALVRVRYLSEARLPHTAHLQFMPHLADALSELMGGKVVFDHQAEVLWTAEQFHASLEQTPNAERPEAHVRVAWKQEAEGCYAQTFGLRKVGLRDLTSDVQEDDHKVLISGLMMRLAFHLVRNPEDEGPWEFDEFGDAFTIKVTGRKGDRTLVAISRKVVVSG